MKLSQKQVAEKIGMAQSMVSDLENDVHTKSGYTIDLAHLYRVSARWLAYEKGPREIATVELLDDPEVADLLRRYDAASDEVKTMVKYLLTHEKK